MTTTGPAHHNATPEAEIAEIASQLRLIVGRLTRRLRLHTRGDRLTSTQLATLSTIATDGPMRIGDLAAAEGLSGATMTAVVTALADLAMIERRPDPDDKRACQVLLSEHGSSEIERLRTERTGYLATRLAQCTPEQRAALAQALPVLELLTQDATSETS